MPNFIDSCDPLGKSSLLRTNVVRREIFDPTKHEHQLSLKHYLDTGTWGEIQFYAEHPFTEVPITVLTKYAKFVLKYEA